MSGFANEMRKKSHVTVQKWVDSISVADDKINCDSNELKVDETEPSTSGEAGSATNSTTTVKEKITEICNKLHVNEKLKSSKIDFKNLLSKTTHKIKKQSSTDTIDMEEAEVQPTEDESSDKINKHTDDVKIIQSESITDKNDKTNDNVEKPEEEEESKHEEIKIDALAVQRCHISVLGRSSSENPNPRIRRLTDIGRSFSVAHDDPELQIDSTENLIYDADEDISIAIPSIDTSPSVNNQSNGSITLRPSLGQLNARPLREHTVSEGHYSPHVLPKNPLLRDSSFQVSQSNLIMNNCLTINCMLLPYSPIQVIAHRLKVYWKHVKPMRKQY